MGPFKHREVFRALVADLEGDPAVQSMRALPQHAPGISCYQHSLLVAYLSYRLCRFLGLDAGAAARGGLLHDFYLYNWLDKSTHPHFNHGVHHPLVALENARARFVLTEKEADIIATHMFPLTITRPYGCVESLVVSTADKLCAAAELLRLAPLWLRGLEDTPCIPAAAVVK